MQSQQQEAPNGCGCGRGHGRRRQDGAAHGCDLSVAIEVGAPLRVEAHAAVLEALDDEYRARAFYLAVLERFPGALPFAHIVDSEDRHANKLIEILRAYGRDIPANSYIGSDDIRRSVPASRACACDLAVDEEKHNVSLYETRLLPAVVAFPAITHVFTRLMLASRERHLPAFQRWSATYRHWK
ncbi:hypothetical protein [Rhodoblastus sp.]|uniref:ferritin-like domain-containing protein n=1 Tax=Rhodoblastus sp. TaxID=1962975 RepID=UPI0035B3DD38